MKKEAITVTGDKPFGKGFREIDFQIRQSELEKDAIFQQITSLVKEAIASEKSDDRTTI